MDTYFHEEQYTFQIKIFFCCNEHRRGKRRYSTFDIIRKPFDVSYESAVHDEPRGVSICVHHEAADRAGVRRLIPRVVSRVRLTSGLQKVKYLFRAPFKK